MATLDITFGPAPIFRQKAHPIEEVDDAVRKFAADLLDTMYEFRGIGMAANMVGVLKRIIVVDIQENNERNPLICINPKITWHSTEEELREEASLSYPGISAELKRPNEIKLSYLDIEGNKQELTAKGWLATVIQHEMDYLDGRTFLDRLSKMKRDRLIKKMQKQAKGHSACGDPHCGHEH
ncbi:MAG: peptide deformylase [Kordiimonadaceae bacterium]|nr:peptide deformylase [Kordiimonadaceae bacterium]